MVRKNAVAGLLLLLCSAGLMLLWGCGDDDASSAKMQFAADLKGAAEVPANTSTATGTLRMSLSEDGNTLSYHLEISPMNNVFMAHLHMGGPTCACPIVLFLLTAAANGGPTSGVIAEGAATTVSFSGQLAGHPMSDLIDQIKAGNIYVNVHTSSTTGTIPSGQPGNIPGGEIRGPVTITSQ
jgi:hypothetical protein